jgi:Tol biopolymer transport system component
MKNHMLHAALALSLGITSPALAGQAAPKSNDAAVLLQAAMHTEQVEGRLPEAIDAYKTVVARAGANTAVAAQALLRLGAAYEKLGRPEAREAYERVVRNYPDQPKAAAAAKARLAKVGGGVVVKKAQAEITPHKVLEGHEASVFDITPDGRLGVGTTRSGANRFDVVLRDLTTGKITVLVPGEGVPGKSGSWPRISEDGKRVAYQWRDGDVSSVRVVSTEPGATPQVIASASGKILAPMDWAPDGSAILTARISFADANRTKREGTELIWHPLDRTAARPVKQFGSWVSGESFAMSPKVSPDGRHIAFIAADRADAADAYLRVIDADGGNESIVVASAGERRYPMWAPDGGQVLYTEGDPSNSTLWAVPVRVGQRAGEPTVVYRNLTGVPVGITAAGTLLTRTVGGGPRVYLTDRRPSQGATVSQFEGLNPAFSKDGRYVAFMRWSREWTNLIVREIESGKEQTYKPARLLDPAPAWRHDGGALVVTMLEGVDQTATRVAALLDLKSGSTTQLFDRQGPDRERSRGPLSLDGKTVYAARTGTNRTAVIDIVARDLASGTEQILTTVDPSPAYRAEVGLALSPDGKTLAVALWKTPNESARLLTVGVDGTGLRELVPSFQTAWISDAVRWTPDGQSVLYVAFDAQKNWRVMRVGTNGGTPEPDGFDYETLDPLVGSPRLELSNFIGFDLSPDGSRVVASTRTRAMSEIWALDVAALMAAK